LLVPKPRGRAIRLALPENAGAGGEVVGMFTAALHALAAGDITPDEAVQVSRFLEGRWRVLRAWQMERRLTRYEDQPPIPGDDWLPDEDAGEAGVAAAEESSPTAAPLTLPSLRDRPSLSHEGRGEVGGDGEGGESPLPSWERPFDKCSGGPAAGGRVRGCRGRRPTPPRGTPRPR